MTSGEPGEPHDVHADARFVLANERTYLAWMRTCLGLVAGGLALMQFLRLDGSRLVGLVLGLLLMVAGGAIALMAYARYRSIDEAMHTGRPLPVSHLPAALVLLVAAVALLAAVLVAWLG